MKKYRPTNGTEGMSFCEKFCENCIFENDCDIIFLSMSFDVEDDHYPKELQYDKNGEPICINFKKG